MLLSVLIPTIPDRTVTFWSPLVLKLCEAAKAHPDVEVLSLFDNRKRSVGAKRNDLLNLARGKFLTFIDDDDWVTADYLDVICPILREKDPDVLCFTQLVSINGGETKPCHYGIDLPYYETDDLWQGKPAHTMVWRSAIAKPIMFPDASFGEDFNWVARACVGVSLENQVRIENTLYHYKFNDETSRTRGK
jgi:glycosyltransferase involved in cell wall biosynthesis